VAGCGRWLCDASERPAALGASRAPPPVWDLCSLPWVRGVPRGWREEECCAEMPAHPHPTPSQPPASPGRRPRACRSDAAGLLALADGGAYLADLPAQPAPPAGARPCACVCVCLSLDPFPPRPHTRPQEQQGEQAAVRQQQEHAAGAPARGCHWTARLRQRQRGAAGTPAGQSRAPAAAARRAAAAEQMHGGRQHRPACPQRRGSRGRRGAQPEGPLSARVPIPAAAGCPGLRRGPTGAPGLVARRHLPLQAAQRVRAVPADAALRGPALPRASARRPGRRDRGRLRRRRVAGLRSAEQAGGARERALARPREGCSAVARARLGSAAAVRPRPTLRTGLATALGEDGARGGGRVGAPRVPGRQRAGRARRSRGGPPPQHSLGRGHLQQLQQQQQQPAERGTGRRLKIKGDTDAAEPTEGAAQARGRAKNTRPRGAGRGAAARASQSDGGGKRKRRRRGESGERALVERRGTGGRGGRGRCVCRRAGAARGDDAAEGEEAAVDDEDADGPGARAHRGDASPGHARDAAWYDFHGSGALPPPTGGAARLLQAAAAEDSAMYGGLATI